MEEIGVKIYELCQQGELVIRIIIAALIGCMIGYERKNREKSAGLRTHAIGPCPVCTRESAVCFETAGSFANQALGFLNSGRSNV